jgi:hypothetical protein
MIYCNNQKYKFYTEQSCTAATVFYVDRLCVTFRKQSRKENFHELMKSPIKSNCHREAGKYKSNRGRVVK